MWLNMTFMNIVDFHEASIVEKNLLRTSLLISILLRLETDVICKYQQFQRLSVHFVKATWKPLEFSCLISTYPKPRPQKKRRTSATMTSEGLAFVMFIFRRIASGFMFQIVLSCLIIVFAHGSSILFYHSTIPSNYHPLYCSQRASVREIPPKVKSLWNSNSIRMVDLCVSFITCMHVIVLRCSLEGLKMVWIDIDYNFIYTVISKSALWSLDIKHLQRYTSINHHHISTAQQQQQQPSSRSPLRFWPVEHCIRIEANKKATGNAMSPSLRSVETNQIVSLAA